MDKNRTYQEKYERYVDATVDLIMNRYNDILTENIRTEVDELENMQTEFPPHLHDQCMALIKNAHKKRKQQQRGKQVLKVLRMAAVFALVLLSLTSILFVTVEAIRLPIINFFIEKNENYWNITTDTQEHWETYTDTVDWTDPLQGLLDEEYKLVFQEGDSCHDAAVIYENSNAEQIFFSARPTESSIRIDSEDIDYSKELLICDYDAILVAEDHIITLVWMHNRLDAIYTIVADGITESQVIHIAEQLTSITG